MKLKTHMQSMKIDKLILTCGALAGIIITGSFTTYAESPTPAPTSNPLITWTAGGKQSKKVDVLFVQNAKNVSFSKGKIVLCGVNPVTVCFTDRCEIAAGISSTKHVYPPSLAGSKTAVSFMPTNYHPQVASSERQLCSSTHKTNL